MNIYTNPSQTRGSKLADFSNSRFFCYFPPNSRSQTLKFAVFEIFYAYSKLSNNKLKSTPNQKEAIKF